MGPQPDAPLSELCGGPKAEPCPTLTEHLAALRAKECGSQPTAPTQRACGPFTQVDVDYGVVGYTRFFDTTGTIVGAIAHLYEYGGSRRYGAVPTDCSGGRATSVCTRAAPASSAK